MEKMTEYEWEQRVKERKAFVQSQITSSIMAYDKGKNESRHESCLFSELESLKARLKLEGWELFQFGQSVVLFSGIWSGIFVRPKK